MAEVLGAVAAATQLTQLGLQIIDLCRRVRDSSAVAAARAEQVQQLVSLAALVPKNPILQTTPLLEAALSDCLRDAEALRDVLAKVTPDPEARKVTRFLKAVDGAAKERRIAELCKKLEWRKSMLSLCIASVDAELLNSMNTDLSAVREGVGKANEDLPAIRQAVERLAVGSPKATEPTAEDVKQACRASLGFSGGRHFPRSPISISDDAYRWFFETEEFKSWDREISSSKLLIKAGPGCGKTALATRVVKYLETNARPPMANQEPDHALLSFFFSAASADTCGNATACLRSLIAQLVDRIPSSFPFLLQEYNRLGAAGNVNWTFEALSELFIGMIHAVQPVLVVTIVLDALDECQSGSRESLMQLLNSIIADTRCSSSRNFVAIKILATSRPNEDLTYTWRPSAVFPINESHTRLDMRKHIFNGIQKLVTRRNLNKAMEQVLITFFEQNARGMFLWVNLVLDELGRRDQRLTNEAIDAKLAKVPLTLKNIYVSILEAAPMDRKSDMWRILRLLSYSRQTLSLEELHFALCIEPSTSTWHDLEGDIRYLCGCLVAIEDGEVYWVHQTAKDQVSEYIASSRPEETGGINLYPAEGCSYMAQLCIDALMSFGSSSNLRDPMESIDRCTISEYSDIIEAWLRDRPFLAYAGQYWHVHVNMVRCQSSKGNVGSDCTSKLKRLLESQARRDALMRLSYHFTHLGTLGSLHGASALHLAGYFDLPELVDSYLAEGFDANSRADMGDTPLVWASEVGSVRCAQTLLKRGRADPNLCEFDGWTPLHW